MEVRNRKSKNNFNNKKEITRTNSAKFDFYELANEDCIKKFNNEKVYISISSFILLNNFNGTM